ncbi:uncharacterized protein LOC132196330 [Neocloeon triangulifer]|uniref:uncharacterized protein LOC132196330 n=1 Tax=Neocloeon triangulifer TaxID=2078957 RepID=UPI00286F557A|nr:uncharacterized protein LOC132196330 [Neocloeon triangulifer]
MLKIYTSACISECLDLMDEINPLKCHYNRIDGQVVAKNCSKCPMFPATETRRLRYVRAVCASIIPTLVSICGKRMIIGVGDNDESDFFFYPALVLNKGDLRMWEPKDVEEIKCVLEQGLTTKQLISKRVWISAYKPACRNAPKMTYDLTFCSQKFSKPFDSDLLPWAPATTDLTGKNACVVLQFKFNTTNKSTSEYAYREVDCDTETAVIVQEYLRMNYRPFQ